MDTQQTPSFTVYDEHGKLLPHIKHCFLENRIINIANPPASFRSKQGTMYQAVYDNFTVASDAVNIKVIISFQKHDNGAFAVIRPALLP